MSRWNNHGDVNFVEYGGILLSKVEGSDTEFEFIQVIESSGDNRMFATTGVVDTKDYDTEERKANIIGSAGILPSDNHDDYNENYAVAIIEYYGGMALYGKPLIGDSYYVTKYELCKQLNDVGFECEYDLYNEIKALDNEQLADWIEDYVYARGEYDMKALDWVEPEDEDDRWKTVHHIERMLESEKGIKDLYKYFELELSAMPEEDELYEKAQIFKDVTADRLEKEKIKASVEKEGV